MHRPNVYRTGAHYRERAEECRTIAEMLHGEGPKKHMRGVAADYDKMASLADKMTEDLRDEPK